MKKDILLATFYSIIAQLFVSFFLVTFVISFLLSALLRPEVNNLDISWGFIITLIIIIIIFLISIGINLLAVRVFIKNKNDLKKYSLAMLVIYILLSLTSVLAQDSINAALVNFGISLVQDLAIIAATYFFGQKVMMKEQLKSVNNVKDYTEISNLDETKTDKK